jgi:hypothetical protein
MTGSQSRQRLPVTDHLSKEKTPEEIREHAKRQLLKSNLTELDRIKYEAYTRYQEPNI